MEMKCNEGEEEDCAIGQLVTISQSKSDKDEAGKLRVPVSFVEYNLGRHRVIPFALANRTGGPYQEIDPSAVNEKSKWRGTIDIIAEVVYLDGTQKRTLRSYGICTNEPLEEKRRWYWNDYGCGPEGDYLCCRIRVPAFKKIKEIKAVSKVPRDPEETEYPLSSAKNGIILILFDEKADLAVAREGLLRKLYYPTLNEWAPRTISPPSRLKIIKERSNSEADQSSGRPNGGDQ